MRIICLTLLVLLASVTMASSEPKPFNLALRVDWGKAKLNQLFPVSGGVPIARGVLKSPNEVTLQLDGRPVELQTEALATWPDGSVKWLLLDFQAMPGQENFTLKYAHTLNAPVAGGIRTKASADAVEVDTGVVKLTVRKDGTGFIDELAYKGAKVSTSAGKRFNIMDCIHTASPADYHPKNRYVKNGIADPSKVVVNSVTLEKSGPMHAVILIDGKYTYKLVGSTITGTDIKGDCPFRIRIHAYKGRSILKVEHFFYYEGDGDHDFVKSLSLKLGLPGGAGKVRFIGDETTAVAGPLAGLYQQSADAFSVWTSKGAHASCIGTAYTLHRA